MLYKILDLLQDWSQTNSICPCCWNQCHWQCEMWSSFQSTDAWWGSK